MAVEKWPFGDWRGRLGKMSDQYHNWPGNVCHIAPASLLMVLYRRVGAPPLRVMSTVQARRGSRTIHRGWKQTMMSRRVYEPLARIIQKRGNSWTSKGI